MLTTSSYGSRKAKSSDNERRAKPYCQCWNKGTPIAWRQLNTCCSCGEDNEESEWKWEKPVESGSSWVVVSEDLKQVTFHPFYSSGTAAAKGDSPLKLNHQYYWEVKMLSETYGTDIMVGIGTDKVDVAAAQFQFTSLLGQDAESYGLSYTGALRHNATVERDGVGFCRGSIVGVRVDLWHGTLEFYLNRKPQGISFYNLRSHKGLFPMICSTAAQSSMRLIYASSWKASLLVDAAKVLAAGVRDKMRLPPGLWYSLKNQFWMTMPSEGCILEDDEKEDNMEIEPVPLFPSVPQPLSTGMKRRHWQMMTVPACVRDDA